MGRFLRRRITGLVVTLLATSFVVYASMAAAPGGSESVLYGGRTPTPAIKAAVRAEYHLDDPFLVRYGRWLAGAAHGDFGISIVGHQRVASRIGATVGVTLWLVALAAVIVIVAGIGLGLLAALRPGPVDTIVTAVSSITVGVPSFVAAALAIDIFALRLHWFPAYGEQPTFLGRIHSLILPAASLALLSAALVTRVTRTSVRAELGREYVTTAETRALPRHVVIRRHILRNAAAPILTAGGLQIASLFAGTVIVETAFGLQGLGSLLLSSVSQKDFPTVQAITMIMVTAFVVTNLVVDVAQALIDPRIRAAVTA
jgi:peptide/nickel transport system permease protein